MTLGEKLKKARLEAGLTQDELAARLMISRQAVSKWESDRGMPDINNIKAISDLLDISIDYLLDDGSSLDLNMTRERIDLSAYSYDQAEANWREKLKNKILGKKGIKNRIVCEKFPGARVLMLMPESKASTKGEKLVDTAVFLLTDAPLGTIDLAKTANLIGTEYYLVERGEEQYLVTVSDEFMESRRLADRVSGKKFTVGDILFRIVQRDISKD